MEEKIKEEEKEEEEKIGTIDCILEKCKYCNEESISKNLCLECNNQKEFYYLNIKSIKFGYENNGNFIDCVNSTTKPSNFYFNKINKDYEPCYYTCSSCEYGGNEKIHNCTSCESYLILMPDIINSTNCIKECNYLYYYSNYQYKCTSSYQCPKKYNLIIKEKGKCIDNCENDNTHKYQYNGECYKECPNNTYHDENKYLCKDITLNKCILQEKPYSSLKENITDEEIEEFAKNYAIEFNYTDNHISSFTNNIYKITFYKNAECISDLNLEIPQINFSNCEAKIKQNLTINESLVIAIISKKDDIDNYSKMISYSMFEPNSGEKINTNDICNNEKIILKENLLAKIDKSKVNLEFILYLTNQNIDIFDIHGIFYTDICFHFDSPINKDIALKDRILLCFPNVTLCENDCSIKGVNLTDLKAICECKFNNIIGVNKLSKKFLAQSSIGEIENLLKQVNIEIIKCYKDVFDYKYFVSNTGGFMIIALIIIQIISVFLYFKKSFFIIKKYIFGIVNKYLLYLAEQKNNNNNNNNNRMKKFKTCKFNEPHKKKYKNN